MPVQVSFVMSSNFCVHIYGLFPSNMPALFVNSRVFFFRSERIHVLHYKRNCIATQEVCGLRIASAQSNKDANDDPPNSPIVSRLFNQCDSRKFGIGSLTL